jgi:hypothetical protein
MSPEADRFDTAFDAETELLLATLRSHLGTASRLSTAELGAAQLDWHRVEKLARSHGILPVVYEQLSTDEGSVPRDTHTSLQTASREIAQQNLFLLEETLSLIEYLGEHGVQAVPYKGPVLGATVYGDVSLRQSVDIDLLIRPGDMDMAEALLRERGYERPERERRVERLLGEQGLTHHRTFYRSEDRVRVDLHHRLTAAWMVTELRMADLLDALESVEVHGHSVSVLEPENRLLALCVHGSKHRWERLEWLCDVGQLIRTSELDWETMLARARVAGVERLVLIGLYLAAELLQVALPEIVTRAIEADPAVESIAHEMANRSLGSGTESRPVENVWLLSRTLDGRSARFRTLLRLAFSPTAADVEAIRLPATLASLYYVVRPVRIVVGIVRGDL